MNLGCFCGVETLLPRKNAHNIRIQFRHEYLQGLIWFLNGQRIERRRRIQSVQVPTIAIDRAQTISRSIRKQAIEQFHLQSAMLRGYFFKGRWLPPPGRNADEAKSAARASCNFSSSKTGLRHLWSRRTVRPATTDSECRARASWCRTFLIWNAVSTQTWSSRCNKNRGQNIVGSVAGDELKWTNLYSYHTTSAVRIGFTYTQI